MSSVKPSVGVDCCGPFASFDDYLEGLSRSRRALVRREARALESAGLATHVVSFEEGLEQGLSDLVSEVKRRHGVMEPPRLVALRLARWAAAVPTAPRAVLVRHRGRLVAAAAIREHEGHHEVYTVGLDDDFEHRFLAYAAACFQEPIRRMSRSGGRMLDLGVGTSEAKVLRGATAVPSCGVVGPLP